MDDPVPLCVTNQYTPTTEDTPAPTGVPTLPLLHGNEDESLSPVHMVSSSQPPVDNAGNAAVESLPPVVFDPLPTKHTNQKQGAGFSENSAALTDAPMPSELQKDHHHICRDERKQLKRERRDERRRRREEKKEVRKRKREEKNESTESIYLSRTTESDTLSNNSASSDIPPASSLSQSQPAQAKAIFSTPSPSSEAALAKERPASIRLRYTAPIPTHSSSGPADGLAKHSSFTLPLAADIAHIGARPLVDFSNVMVLKPGCFTLPIIVCPTGHIFLEMMHPMSKTASDFLVTVAEPLSRPENIHEFQITVFSLYAAIGIGMSVKDIVHNLDKFSKNEIPSDLQNLLHLHGNAFGRVKLVLRDNRYYLEAQEREDLEYMLSNPAIAEARIRNSMMTKQIRLPVPAKDLQTATTTQSAFAPHENPPPTDTEHSDSKTNEPPPDDLNGSGLESADAPVLDPSLLGFTLSEKGALESGRNRQPTKVPAVKQVFLFEVKENLVGRVKEVALTELRRPLVSEYDFRRDHKNPTLQIALKPSTKIRYYQERALRKMFSNGRARSGIIVLPCGAGKTLTGITAATTIGKSTMVLTSSSVAVDQWKRSFADFTTIDGASIVTLTSDKKNDLPKGAAILISTYTMMSYSGKRSVAAEEILDQIRQREWGLLIFDEVQFAPAPAFRKINDIVKSHCKLGLTATLVREDDLIHDLQWLIGPKLYEANWLELQEAGYLAKVQVSEVWCPMTPDFYREYLKAPHAKQRKLWVCNPNKLRVCEYLLRFHEARNDKIIVFSDNLFALKEVAFTLKRPFLSGEVGMHERMLILNKFKTSPTLNTIFLSKVGDNAIDIPCANVVIQISFNFASRRQEAQRLGRILRPKAKGNETFNAFFYSLLSKDTQEMLYADKRQQFIIDQGYAYKVLPISVFPMEHEQLVYDDPRRQKDVLARVMSSSDQSMDIEDDDVVLNDSAVNIAGLPTAGDDTLSKAVGGSLRTTRTSLAKLSGGGAGFPSLSGSLHSSMARVEPEAKRHGRAPFSSHSTSTGPREVHPFFKTFLKNRR